MEQRYQAVLAVVGEGISVTEVSSRFGVLVRRFIAWLARYEAGGIAALADRSHAVRSCPHQMDPDVEVLVVQMRLEHRGWGQRRDEDFAAGNVVVRWSCGRWTWLVVFCLPMTLS